MGWVWEVKVWREIDNIYGYHSYWRGDSFVMAVFNMLKAKRKGWGCIALEWR